MEKSLLKQALSMGMDEGWIIRPLPGGEPPPWRALSRESSVPLEAWLTESQTKSKPYLHDRHNLPIQTITGTNTLKGKFFLEVAEPSTSIINGQPLFKSCLAFFDAMWLPVDELEVRACKMESACKVAIILSISSACCSRPTSSRASSAAKDRGKRSRHQKVYLETLRLAQNPASTHPVTQRLTDPVTQASQQQLEVQPLGYQPRQCMGCTHMCHSQHPSSHTKCCLQAENGYEKDSMRNMTASSNTFTLLLTDSDQ